MTQDERLLNAVKQATDKALTAEVLQLTRKLKRALTQRDQWKYRAHHYRDKLIAREPK